MLWFSFYQRGYKNKYKLNLDIIQKNVNTFISKDYNLKERQIFDSS